MEKPQRVLLDISWEALLKIVALAVGLWAVVMLHEVLIMLFVRVYFCSGSKSDHCPPAGSYVTSARGFRLLCRYVAGGTRPILYPVAAACP